MGLQWVVWGFLCLLGHYVHLLVAVEGSWSIKLDLDLELLCDVHGFHYTVSTKPQKLHSVQFRGFDKQGLSMVISNSSDCGTSVVIRPGGSVLLQAAYEGCYSYNQVDHYAMPVLVEYDLGKFMSSELKELRCPKLPVNVQCMHDGQMSIAISKHLTEPPLRLHSIHVNNGKADLCGPILRTNELVLFKFPLTTCGTTSKERDGKLIYENVVVAAMNVRKKTANAKTISGNQLRMHIQCMLDPNDLSIQNSSDVPMPPSWLVGSLHLHGLQLRIAKDNFFQEFYTDGNHSVLKMPYNHMIPIEVRISTEHVESNMTLVLTECWATPNRDPNNRHQWPILMNGCPFVGDNYESRHMSPMRSHSHHFPSHYRRILIHTNYSGSPPSQMSLHGMVYFHCHALMMYDHYGPLCQKRHWRRNTETSAANVSGNRSVHGNANMTVLVSSHVPVYFPASESTHDSGKGSPTYSGPLGREWVRIVIVVSVLASIIMVCFIAKRKCKAQTENA